MLVQTTWQVRDGTPTAELEFSRHDLGTLRGLVRRECAQAGFDGARLWDLTLAVDEIATNAIVHGGPPTRLRLWRTPGELIWEVSDRGPGISDPLAGQHAPDPGAPGGRGLWIARRICDSLEFRSDDSGTIVALHVALPSG